VNTEKHLGVLLLYIAYFPLLVAGPIARAEHLIPQLKRLTSDAVEYVSKYDYDKTVSGLRLILLGFFKKVVLADNFAKFVEPVYAAPEQFNGISALIATLAFAMQIYFDFSAYTDIARGASRIMGVELNENFNNPYFARNIQDFWRRWHISLSTWFRDYVYIPLGGNRLGDARMYANLGLVFILCGIWHGANWTFLIWGLLHGFYICAARMKRLMVTNQSTSKGESKQDTNCINIITTFAFVVFAWAMFRADDVDKGIIIWINILSIPLDLIDYIYLVLFDQLKFSIVNYLGIKWLIFLNGKMTLLFIYIVLLTITYFIFEYKMKEVNSLPPFNSWTAKSRWLVYVVALLLTCMLGDFGASQFIYFQF
jgi:D-alanyl-lipoteichoic acid acyltransferase DltB (MBOAT superfamily)